MNTTRFTFHDSEYRLFVPTLALATLAILSADVRLVDFYRTFHLLLIEVSEDHRFADTMREIPSGLIADSQVAPQLPGANTLLGVAHYRGSLHPLLKREMGVVKDRSSGSSELLAAFEALVQMPVRAANFFTVAVDAGATLGYKLGHLVMVAFNATNAVRPAQCFQEGQALFLGSKFILDRYQALSDSGVFGHDQ